MRLDVCYNLCSKLRSKLIFWRNYSNFSFANPFSDFDCIFRSVVFLKVGPDKIYACSQSEIQISKPVTFPKIVWIMFNWNLYSKIQLDDTESEETSHATGRSGCIELLLWAGATWFYGRWSQADLQGSLISLCRSPIQIFVWWGPIQIAENHRKIAENPSFRPTSEGHSYYYRP